MQGSAGVAHKHLFSFLAAATHDLTPDYPSAVGEGLTADGCNVTYIQTQRGVEGRKKLFGWHKGKEGKRRKGDGKYHSFLSVNLHDHACARPPASLLRAAGAGAVLPETISKQTRQEEAAAATEGANTLIQQMFLPACVCFTVLKTEGFVSIFNEISTSVQTLYRALTNTT